METIASDPAVPEDNWPSYPECLATILDSSDSCAYLADMETHEIIFLNQQARELWGDVIGEKCWVIFQNGQSGPCAFCNNDQLLTPDGRPTGVGIREVFRNTLNGRLYHCRDRAMRWMDGRMVRLSLLRDITELKQAEEDLRLSEEKFSKAFRSSPSLMAISTFPEGRNVEVNDAYLRTTGLSREEAVGKQSIELGFWEGREDREKFLRLLKEYGSVSNFNVSFRGKSGQVLELLLSAELIPIGDRQYQLLSMNDVTEAVHMREELRAAHQKLADIIEFLPDATFVVDNERRVTAWNRAMEEMTGVAKKDIIGKGDQCYSIPFYGKPTPGLLDLVFTGDTRIGEESGYDFMTRRGKSVFAETFMPLLFGGRGAVVWAAAAPLLDTNGNTYGAVETIRDMSERIKMERLLEGSEVKYRTLFEATSEAVLLLDDTCIIDCNQAAVTMFKYDDRQGLLEKHPVELSSCVLEGREELIRRIKRLRGEALQKGSSLFDWRFLMADATEFLGEVVLTPMELEGRQAFQAVIRDITERRKFEEELKLKGLLLDEATDSIFVMDLQGKLVYVNEAACKTRGYSRDELIEMRMQDLDASEAGTFVEDSLAIVHEKGMIISESVHICKDGSLMPVEIHARKIESGGVSLILGIARDITERQQAEKALSESESRYRAIFENTGTAILIVDGNNNICMANAECFSLTGYPPEIMAGGRKWPEFIAREDIERLKEYAAMWDTDPAHAPRSFEFRFIDRCGNTKNAIAVVAGIPGGKKAVVSIQDITERKRMEEDLKFLSLHDPMTGLYNRAYFEQEMTRLEGGRDYPVTILTADLDGLKVVNDTMGHSKGDVIIRACGKLLEDAFRRSDVVARIGGDEFAVILPRTSALTGLQLISKLEETVAAYNDDHPYLPVRISVGSATADDQSVSLEEVLRRADMDMYLNKVQRLKSSDCVQRPWEKPFNPIIK